MRDLDAVFDALQRSPFRRRQALCGADRRCLAARGLGVIMDHARHFMVDRLAPAAPPNDGRQTPMRGHPVFTAQHATATCCRSCLAKWHHIEKGRPLSESEIAHVLAAVERWLTEAGSAEQHAVDAADPMLWDER